MTDTAGIIDIYSQKAVKFPSPESVIGTCQSPHRTPIPTLTHSALNRC
jgi:hypothetical protein